MKNCKVLLPFVNRDNGISLKVNDTIELEEERAKELEDKGLVAITANPLSNPQKNENSTLNDDATTDDNALANNPDDDATTDDNTLANNLDDNTTNDDTNDVPLANNFTEEVKTYRTRRK